MSHRFGFLKGLAIFAITLGIAGCNLTSEDAKSAAPAESPPSQSAGPVVADPVVTDPVVTYEAAFSADRFDASQPAGSVELTILRRGTAGSAITIDYRTVDGTAVAGTNYTSTQGRLSWGENDSTPKTITIALSPTPFSGTREFTVALSNPSTSASIGSPGVATVVIQSAESLNPGTLAFANPTYSTSQSSTSLPVSVSRAGGTYGAVSVGYSTVNGTAAAGVDFTTTTGTLSWPDGDASPKTISIPVRATTAYVGSRNFTIALQTPTGGAQLGTPNLATASLVGTGTPPVGTLRLASSSYTVAQTAGTLVVQVSRVGGTAGAASVAYATSNGTAVAGTDYTTRSGTLRWADGDAADKSFSIPISNAAPFSGSKTFTVALSAPSAGAAISSPGSLTVTISGSGAAATGTVKFSASSYTVSQGAGAVSLSVTRTGGSAGAGSVSYFLANGTAVAGTDYTTGTGTLNWADGDAASKTISIPVSAATPFSGTRSFSVTLSNAVNVSLGTPAQAQVNITGTAVTVVPGSLQFSASSYSVGQANGSVTVTVNRTGGTGGAVGVSYSTSSGTAVAGTDFTATSGTLSWASGDAASKTFSVPVSTAAFSGTRTFTVQLATATGGATLSTPSSATVSVLGSGATVPGTKAPFFVYRDGIFNWGGNYDYLVSSNYNDTTGMPTTGTFDTKVTVTGAWGGYQPYAGGTVPMWNFDSTGYTNFCFDFKPNIAGQTIKLYFMDVGDIPLNHDVTVFSGNYGPAPQVGVWGRYCVPLNTLGVLGRSIYKFGIQDTTGKTGHFWFVNNLSFE